MEKMNHKKIYLQKLVHILWRDITALGGTFFYIFITLLVGVIGKTEVLQKLALSFIITMIVIVGIRTFYFKPRPAKQSYHNYIERLDASSFPSWHTARAIILALFVGKSIQSLPVIIFLIAIALLVGYSRIYLRKHDYGDVLGGMVLGMGTYWIVGFI